MPLKGGKGPMPTPLGRNQRRYWKSAPMKPGQSRICCILLDEVSFLSAASWYIEGFAKRSGITVTTDLPCSLPRLPEEIEVTLFRILQESLTNIHRHSESSSAEISLALCNREVSLQVRDRGRGISPVMLQRFQKSGTGAGVGLSGIHERVTDVGGAMEIRSDSQGTLVIVKIPISPTDVPQS